MSSKNKRKKKDECHRNGKKIRIEFNKCNYLRIKRTQPSPEALQGSLVEGGRRPMYLLWNGSRDHELLHWPALRRLRVRPEIGLP